MKNLVFAKPVVGPVAFFEGEGAAAKFELSKDPAFIEQTKMIQGLATIVRQQNAAIGQLNQTIANSQNKGGKKGGEGEGEGDGEDTDDDEVDEEDMEKMPKKKFFDMMMKEVGKILESGLKDVKTKVDGIGTYVKNKETKDEVIAFAGTHKDLREWDAEISELIKTHPTLGISELYTLARANHPDKTKTMEAKYNPPKEGGDDTLSLFGGFRPSIGKGEGNGEGEGKKKDMTIDKALDTAWNDAVAKVPGLAAMGDDVVD